MSSGFDPEVPPETVYNCMEDEKKICFMAGLYSRLEPTKWDPLYKFYQICEFFIIISCIIMTAESAILIVDRRYIVLRFEAGHMLLLLTVVLMFLTNGLTHKSDVLQGLEILRKGVYHYSEDFIVRGAREIKSKGVKHIKFLHRFYFLLLSNSAVIYVMSAPLKNLLISDDTPGPEFLNPLHSIPYYFPFDSKTKFATVLGIALNICSFFYISTVLLSVCETFFCFMIQIRSEFEVLNFSIKNLETRALMRLNLNDALIGNFELYNKPEFQKATFECFRENIIHHQNILRLSDTIKPFLGTMFLIVVVLASAILASALYLLSELRGNYFDLVRFGVNLFCELFFVLHLCWYGEELLTQGEHLFNLVYALPWYHCDQKLKTLVAIVLMRTKKPHGLKSNHYSISASFQTYYYIITTAYQYLNLIRKLKSD